MTRYLLPIAFFAVLIPVFVIGLGKDPTELPSTFLGKSAPELELPLLHDSVQTLSNETFAGQLVLVNFWATWCIGCRQEHGFLMQLAANDVIPIYGVNWRDDRQSALGWLNELGDPYVMSGFDGGNHAGIDWGVYAAPETFLIDASGVVVYKHLGPLSPNVWQREFLPRLSTLNGAVK
jgi:cytochrome c biogenesis protein CcmG, thiol:disulfide interchange protein DsbE